MRVLQLSASNWINWAYIPQSINCVAFTMNRNECLKIMYLSPVAVDDRDELFGEVFKDTKEPGTEVHVTSLNANRGQFSHVEFRSFEAMAIPGIISATICAEKEGFDALVIGCFYDTALHDAREISGNMAVVAPCHSSIEIALGLANNFGIIVGRRKVVERDTYDTCGSGVRVGPKWMWVTRFSDP